MLERPFVRVFGFGFGIVEVTDQPVVVFTARVLSSFKLLAPVTAGLAARTDALDLIRGQIGKIDVEAEWTLRVLMQHGLYELRDVAVYSGEIGVRRVVEQ